jgi:general secretion pathway protein I
MRMDDRCAGFTLIETLVALVIFVAGYLLVYQSVSVGWRGAQVAHTESAALRLAQTRLAAAGVESRLEEGQQSGQSPDGYTWTMQVAGYHRPDRNDTPTRLAAYWVTIEVKWQEGALRRTRSLRLETLKLAPRP